MANQNHLEILKRGVAAWTGWRERNPEVQPDLSGADLNYADLSGVNFYGADLRATNLKGANLYAANLSSANLKSARLNRADLRNATLVFADLTGAFINNATMNKAILTGANLSRAVLINTNLSGADFVNANFTGTDLTVANLSGAEARGAIFNHAVADRTIFANLDLSQTSGLETVRHSGPSEVGIGTVYLSNGNIPEAFLRGCGVPEVFITYMRSLTATPLEFYSCFISYSSVDKIFARRLHDALQGRGIRCWLDEHQLLPGDDIFEQVERGIRLWDKVLLCCSKDSLTSWWVDNEVNSAFEKEQQLMKQRGRRVLALIPLNLDGYMFGGEWESGKATQIKSRLAADFTGWETDHMKFEEQFERLVRALRTDTGARELPPAPRL